MGRNVIKIGILTGIIVSVFTALTIFSVLHIGATAVSTLEAEDKENMTIYLSGWIDGERAEFDITGDVEIADLKTPDNVQIDGSKIKITYEKENAKTQIDMVTAVDLTGTVEEDNCKFEGTVNGITVSVVGEVSVKDGKKVIDASITWDDVYSEPGPYGNGRMAWPVPKGTIVTSPFGYRTHPISGKRKFHTGVDLGGSGIYGTPIVAADDGAVIFTGWNGGYGNCVIVDHGGGYTTLYAHASSLKAETGKTVKRGETIALVGSTGNSTGPHLHFEVRINGQYQNPLPYIKGKE